jgi:hypothetical protein
VRVVGRPLVHERAFPRLEHQQHPAGAAAERLAHGHELLAPALDTAEVRLQRERHRRRHGLSPGAQAVEVQLVQEHGVGGNQLLALEAIDLEHGSRRKREFAELRPNGVEPLHGTAVVVLVVAANQLLRQALERAWFEREVLQ